MYSKLSFTTTALSRPEILEKTYKSFLSNIKGENISECTLYINIDPIPNNGLQQDTLIVAKKYFKNVIYRMSEQPNFSDAINWCWSNTKTPYIFHLEDDWILLKKININNIFDLFNKTKALEIILRAYNTKYKKLALSPSIWKFNLYKTFAGKLNININPEVQLRDKKFAHAFTKNNIIVEGKNVIVKDIGRDWLKNKGLKKPVKSKFVRY